MKKFNYVLAIVVAMVMVAGCNFTNNTNSSKEVMETSKKIPDLTNGIDKVQTSLEDLSTTLENSSDRTNKIQEAGEQLEENWDTIEKQVEEAFPEDYNHIEESLYPLIHEAKKAQPDVQKIKTLLADTKKKIKAFKEKTKPSI
ncbi:hypothetical protein CEW92_18425 [Bacillaceae bacterium SAS-127]|nr:hypothetical protein CEW92_18425 [Bacillaceae bacterium SAS-127]